MPNDLRAWRVAALPAAAVLGIALPLTFASHCEQYLYDFRALDLLPLYATAWLILAAVAVPLWLILTAALRGLEAVRRPPAIFLSGVIRSSLFALAAVVVVATLIGCLRTWLNTFHTHLPLSSDAVLGLAVVAGALVAITEGGRSTIRALMPVALVCTAVGFLSLASLPAFGWSRGGIGHPEQSPVSSTVLAAAPMQTATSLPVSEGTARPNIVLLSIDALSAQHMSLYGYSRPTTPELGQFAQGAVTFDRAYANANFTTPGIATILTGTLPWTHRALQLPVWPLTYTRRESLPAVLERAGYRTGYVSTNAIAGAAKQGFGQYFQFASTDRIGHPTLCADGLSKYLRYVCAAAELSPLQELDDLAARLHGAPQQNLEHDPRLAIDPALQWLASVDRRKPVFLWVHLFPPHSPYAVPSPWLGRFDPSRRDRTVASTEPYWGWIQSRLTAAQVNVLEARYDEAVAYADAYAGPFLERALAMLGPNTAIVVTADHGESFAHDYGAHTGPGLYDEIVHIPLILKLPDETTGARCDDVVQQADIAPTLAALAGIPAPASWEGRSLTTACAAGQADPAADRAVFSMNFEQNPRFAPLRTGSVAVVDGRWKLIRYMGRLHYPFMPALHDELYDVVSDPDELHNLAAQQPAVVQQLSGLIAAALAQHGGRVVPGRYTVSVPPEQSASLPAPGVSGGVAAGSP